MLNNPESQKLMVQRWFNDMWNQWDTSFIDELLHESVTMRGSLGTSMRGKAEVVKYMQFARDAFPDLHHHIISVVSDGIQCVVRVRYTGTHKGKIFNIPPTGRSVEYESAAVFTFLKDRIKDVWIMGDVDGLKMQLQ